jgi:hypothetical protein
MHPPSGDDHILPGDYQSVIEILYAFAELDAGGGVPHERVVAWLESWGTDNELPATC